MELEAKLSAQSALQMRSQRERLWRTFVRNRMAIVGVFIVLFVTLTAIFADDWFLAFFRDRDAQPLLAPFEPNKQDVSRRYNEPSSQYLMGCDNYGRDYLSRIIYGGRVSLVVGVGSILLGCAVGTLMGIVAGYSGGRVENVMMRVIDVLISFPGLILALLLLTVLGAGISRMILAIGVGYASSFARLVHSATLAVKENDYVEAARAIGSSWPRIIRIHILPNILGEIVVVSSLWTAGAIRAEANLSFLGLGVSPPTAAWGSMIRSGMSRLSIAPWLAIYPGVAILLTVLGFNLLGDGLRDVLDPRLQQ